eukprot:403344973
MLKRGTYCVTELYSTQTRKLIVERLIQDRVENRKRQRSILGVSMNPSIYSQSMINTQRNSILYPTQRTSRKYNQNYSPISSIKKDEDILDDESIIDIKETKKEIEVKNKLKEFVYYQNKLIRQNTIKDPLTNKSQTNQESGYTQLLRKTTSSFDLKRLNPQLIQAVLDRNYLGSKERKQKNRRIDRNSETQIKLQLLLQMPHNNLGIKINYTRS